MDPTQAKIIELLREVHLITFEEIERLNMRIVELENQHRQAAEKPIPKPTTKRMPGRLIPFYSHDGSYIDHIAVRRAERLEEMGRAKVVRHRKGHVNRAVLLRGKGEAHATNVRDYVGQAYSFHQPLPDGHRPWKLRPLQGGRSDVNLAPESVRPIFIRVLLDCLVRSAA